jgi:NAD(P)-dependent dehydrogenase (short-subunit alcohol dehydrogenase family)
MPAEQRAAFFAQRGQGLPAGRIGAPEEVASTIHLALRNGFITGAILDVDGGARWKFN